MGNIQGMCCRLRWCQRQRLQTNRAVRATRRRSDARGWRQRRLGKHYNPSQMLRLTLALQPPNMQQEEEFLQELQTKGSPNYHHFLTAEEWTKRFDPSTEDEEAVVDWANSQNLTITHRFPNRLLVDFAA
jgi:hypothetical protein